MPDLQTLVGPPGILWRGAWSSATQYNVNDGVSFNNASYVAVSANLNVNPSTDAGSNWAVVAAAGGVAWEGPWSGSTNYFPGQAVYRNGSAWFAVAASLNVDPATDDGSHWSLMTQAGANGNTVWNGSGAPSNTVGVNGDFYLDTVADVLYGPKASNVWPGSGTALKGAPGTNGNTIWNGSGSPSNTIGVNGDFYIDTVGVFLYGPKASGTWPTGISIKGTSTGQTILKFVAIGDSYTDNGNSASLSGSLNFATQGEQFSSNGPSWFSLLSKAYGFAAIPRWSNVSGGNNYCVAGADIDTGPVFSTVAYDMINQVSTYLADVSNAIAAGTLIAVWMGVNVNRNAQAGFPGSRNSTDPLGSIPAFTMPAPSTTVTITGVSSAIVSMFTIGDWVWIPTAGYLTVAAGTTGTTLVLNNINQMGNATSGTPIPIGNARWGGFQYLDGQIAKFVTQINLLVTAGATKILVLNTPNYGVNTGTGTSAALQGTITNNTAYWNTALAAAMASISPVTMFDVATLWANIVANPPAYGITVVDAGESLESGQPGWSSDRYMFFDSLHPSAATHRIMYNALATQINKLFSPSQQLSLATQTAGIDEANPVIPGPSVFPTGSGALTLAPGANPFPTRINSTDVRLDYLSRLMDSSHLKTEVDWDYTESLTYPANNTAGSYTNGPYVMTVARVGSANLGYNTAPTALIANGMRTFNVVALNDVAGEVVSSVQFIGPNANPAYGGELIMNFASANTLDTGSTIVARLGLMDSLSALANGIFFELTNAAGVITASFVVMTAGTRVVTSLGTPSWASGGNMLGLKSVSDYRWQRHYIYLNGTYVATTGKLSVTPSVALLCGTQLTKTVNGASGNAQVNVDRIRALHLNSRRS